MLTMKEIDAIRFYEGDIRKRDENGQILEGECNTGLFGIPSAYRTMNCLMFDGITNELERIKEKNGKLVPQIYTEIENVIEIYNDIFRAMYKCKACLQEKKPQIVYRTERGGSAEELKKGYSISFMSTSKEEESEEFLRKKTGLTLLNLVVPPDIPQLDFEKVLAGDYYFANQREILLPPFLEIELEEVELTEKEKNYKDADNQPPRGKYLVRIKGIREDNYEAESSERMELTSERNQKAAKILDKLIRNIEITEMEKEEYCLWKKDVRSRLWKDFQKIKDSFCPEDKGKQRKTLMEDVKKMICEFDEKRKEYKTKMQKYSILLMITNIIPLACIAFSFIEAIQLPMKIVAIITSVISIFLSQMLKVEVYNIKLMQRSKTCLKLWELQREMKYETEWNRKNEKMYVQKFQDIMREDTEMSLNNLKVQAENVEKMYQSEIKQ